MTRRRNTNGTAIGRMSGEVGDDRSTPDNENVSETPIVQAQPVVRTERGFVVPDGHGRPLDGSEPAEDVPALAIPLDSSRYRNCCENRACLYSFWGVVASFLIASFTIGFVTSKPWMGALGVLSIIPAVIILYLLYWRNHNSQVELPRGIVGAIPCAVIELLLTFAFGQITGIKTKDVEKGSRGESIENIVLYSLFAAFFVAALCEESLKYYLVVEFPNGIKDVPTAYGTVILSISGALGFATLENIGYVFQDSSTASIGVAVMRALLAVPLHAATGMIIGLNITGALMQREQPVAYKVLWLPILLHGTYDGLLMITLAIGTSTMQGIALLAFAIPLFAFAYG
eukprot:1317884-Amorphochlora_amoeboformis.AAC.1